MALTSKLTFLLFLLGILALMMYSGKSPRLQSLRDNLQQKFNKACVFDSVYEHPITGEEGTSTVTVTGYPRECCDFAEKMFKGTVTQADEAPGVCTSINKAVTVQSIEGGICGGPSCTTGSVSFPNCDVKTEVFGFPQVCFAILEEGRSKWTGMIPEECTQVESFCKRITMSPATEDKPAEEAAVVGENGLESAEEEKEKSFETADEEEDSKGATDEELVEHPSGEKSSHAPQDEISLRPAKTAVEEKTPEAPKDEKPAEPPFKEKAPRAPKQERQTKQQKNQAQKEAAPAKQKVVV